MPDTRVYLDNCCYNRPYDDQSQIRISLESQAKIHIQEMIKNGELELSASYMLVYENSRNHVEVKRKTIYKFLEENTSVYVDESQSEKAEAIAEEIRTTGVKAADAIHTACAIIAGCDYLITTDDRLLKYKTEQIKIVDPTEFIRTIGGEDNE